VLGREDRINERLTDRRNKRPIQTAYTVGARCRQMSTHAADVHTARPSRRRNERTYVVERGQTHALFFIISSILSSRVNTDIFIVRLSFAGCSYNCYRWWQANCSRAIPERRSVAVAEKPCDTVVYKPSQVDSIVQGRYVRSSKNSLQPGRSNFYRCWTASPKQPTVSLALLEFRYLLKTHLFVEDCFSTAVQM